MVGTMGKRRTIPKGKPRTPRQLFAAHLRTLAGDMTTVEIAEAMNVSPNAVGKWLNGSRVPDLDQWPAIAKVLGVDNWTRLVPEI